MEPKLRIHEVAPRDGLQNESVILPTSAKLALLQALVESKPASIEVTSFMRPDKVPQLADADQLVAELWQQAWAVQARREGMAFAGLVANERGLERLLASGLDTLSLLVSASDSHSRANVGMEVDQALKLNLDLLATAKREGLQVRAYVSMAFGCPIEGPVEMSRVMELVTAFQAAEADVVLLADTLGVAKPNQVSELGRAAMEWLPVERLGLHMHDTYGRALENCRQALAMGWHHFDSAAGGLGGCPFAPGAAGNLATELWLADLERNGQAHGMDKTALLRGVARLREAAPGWSSRSPKSDAD